ncbi:MAG: hypothetical protein WC742_12590 [Gallionellaceae bacterium]|jgi:hypothetical protein
MSASIIEQILARATAALTSTTAAQANVFRGRSDALADDEIPGLNIRRAPHNEDAFGQNASRINIDFEVEHFVADSANWETDVDALHMQVHAVLAADAQLAALGRGLRCTGTDPQSDSADRVIGKLTAQYRMQVLVRPGDLTRTIS